MVYVRILARDSEHGSEGGKIVYCQSHPVNAEDKSKCSVFHKNKLKAFVYYKRNLTFIPAQVVLNKSISKTQKVRFFTPAVLANLASLYKWNGIVDATIDNKVSHLMFFLSLG